MRTLLSALLLTAAISVPAFASGEKFDCGMTDKATWMSEDAAKAKGVELGYEVGKIKVEDGCYELYAKDKDGKKLEVFMHPVSGEVVGAKTN